MKRVVTNSLADRPAQYRRADEDARAVVPSQPATTSSFHGLPNDVIEEIIRHLTPRQQLAIRNFCSANRYLWEASKKFRAGVRRAHELDRLPFPPHPRMARETLNQVLTALHSMHPIQVMPLMLKSIRNLPCFLDDPASWTEAFQSLMAFVPGGGPLSHDRQTLLAELAKQLDRAPRGVRNVHCRALLIQSGLDAERTPEAWKQFRQRGEEALQLLRGDAADANDVYDRRTKITNAIKALAAALPLLLGDDDKLAAVDLMGTHLALLEADPAALLDARKAICKGISVIGLPDIRAKCAELALKHLPPLSEMGGELLKSAAFLIEGASPADQAAFFDINLESAASGNLDELKVCGRMLMTAPKQTAELWAAKMAASASELIRAYGETHRLDVLSVLVAVSPHLPPSNQKNHLAAMLKVCVAWRRLLLGRGLTSESFHIVLQHLVAQTHSLRPDDRLEHLKALSPFVLLCRAIPAKRAPQQLEFFFEQVRHLDASKRLGFLLGVICDAPYEHLTDNALLFDPTVMFQATAGCLGMLTPPERDQWVKACIDHPSVTFYDEDNDGDAWWSLIVDLHGRAHNFERHPP